VPREDSSGSRRRLGAITKQGNQFLRWTLVQAAQTAVRGDADLGRQYRRLAARRQRATAKVAVARKLAERLYWMCRRGVGYPEVVR
jgi:transposase